ncbi:MAG TPA: ClpXP protease specificity-enhancing factor [Methylibium sp.]|uniref:ClpXP protease specificity-enhancing factor n=1 Tax=Methylibium sp. TaxID=2067992 RepID=UPI002DBDF5E6|nr:ClpXP protease specificity-enhancing factor [Methylibium sp.]HEU4459298.1 ClpXP protease specificity-enhancing factor [Methylibium sp.]
MSSAPPPPPHAPAVSGASTRPYLIRALHDWCTDNGFTPYLAVYVDANVQVPAEYVKNHEIVLNTSFEATSGLQLGNDFIAFKARFGGVAREIRVPIDHVIAIYARENGQGMAFPAPAAAGEASESPQAPASGDAAGPARSGLRLAPAPGAGTPAEAPAEASIASKDPDDEPPSGPRPTLKRIK